MRTFKAIYNNKIISQLFSVLLIAGFANASHAITAEQASEQVKSLPCKDNMTTDQALDQSIRSHSQRDIGWRIFQEDGYFDVERAVLINKGMELRYRWRVQQDGNIAAENDRTIELCNAG
ncbi:MAG: hypothetical protein ACXV7F_04820 [Methylomonas sp.]